MDVLPTHKNGGIDKPRGFSFSFLFFFSFFWETVENAQITDDSQIFLNKRLFLWNTSKLQDWKLNAVCPENRKSTK